MARTAKKKEWRDRNKAEAIYKEHSEQFDVKVARNCQAILAILDCLFRLFFDDSFSGLAGQKLHALMEMRHSAFRQAVDVGNQIKKRE